MTLRYACTTLVATLLSTLVATPAARAQSIQLVDPSSAEAGTTTPMDITGDGCSFIVPGSTVSFLPATGITHGDVVLREPDVIRTPITIPADTATGLQTVTVSTYGVDCVGVDMFEVTCTDCGAARLLSVTPYRGYTGQFLEVSVVGQDTHFDSNSVLSFSPAGITVDILTPDPDLTALEARIFITVDATLGPRSVLVTTGDEEARGDGLFRVEEETPADVSPDSGVQGQTLLTVEVTGGSTAFTTVTAVDLGEGIDIRGPVNAPDDAMLVLSDVDIAADATVGRRDLTLETTGGQRVYSEVFAVYQGPDTLLLSISPVHGDRGHPDLAVELVGQNTHFDADEVRVLFGDGVLATPEPAVDSFHLTARLEIAYSAGEGQRDVSVQAGGACEWRVPAPCEMVGLDSAFTVTAPGTIHSADPAVVTAGGDVTVALSATDGQFVQGLTSLVLDPPDGIEVLSVVVQGADQLQVDLRIDGDALGEPRDVRAVTGTEVAFGAGLLDVDNPQIVKVEPGAGFQGQSELLLRITGIDIPFSADTLVVFSGQGVSVDEVGFEADEPDELTAVVSIAEDAPTGHRDLTVTAGAVEVTAEEIFTVSSWPTPAEGGCGCAVAHRPAAALFGLPALAWCLRRLRASRRR